MIRANLLYKNLNFSYDVLLALSNHWGKQVRLKTADPTSTSGRRHVADYHSSAADMSKGSGVLP